MNDIHYFTTELGCSCPDRQYRKHECKHMAALVEAIVLVKAQARYNAIVRDLANSDCEEGD